MTREYWDSEIGKMRWRKHLEDVRKRTAEKQQLGRKAALCPKGTSEDTDRL